jgi:hypothetical protein
MKIPLYSGKEIVRSGTGIKTEDTATHFPGKGTCDCRQPAFSPILKTKSPGHELTIKQRRVQVARQQISLVEAIVLQAVEDLWDPAHREESIAFFSGEGFPACAQILGMAGSQRSCLIQMIKHMFQTKDLNCPDPVFLSRA